MLRAFEPWHLVILCGIGVLLFGAKRLPDSARSVGQSLRIFRSEMAASRTPDPNAPADAAGTAGAATPAAAVAAAPVFAPATALAPTAPIDTVTHVQTTTPAQPAEPVAVPEHVSR